MSGNKYTHANNVSLRTHEPLLCRDENKKLYRGWPPNARSGVEQLFKNAADAQDKAEADKWLSDAIAQDLKRGIVAVSREAIQGCEQAAADGNANAMFLLARHYERGVGVEMDVAVANDWFCRAAMGDHVEAALWVADHSVEQVDTPK